MNISQPHNRLRTPLPKIGIRPTIDGRLGGVRESLETQTMNLARATAELIQNNIKHASGLEVEVVIPPFTIGGVSESAQCAALFEREGVGVSLTVTPAWCYGSETMDMNPLTPKAVWGFNGTERPGAVYLAAALAGHAQKGLPAFGIYGKDVQDSGDTSIPADVSEKILTFLPRRTRCGDAARHQLSGDGRHVDGHRGQPGFVGVLRRLSGNAQRIGGYDRVHSPHRTRNLRPRRIRNRARVGESNCSEGLDPNEESKQRTREQKDADWEICVKMALIGRDLMIGNPKLKELGFGEEAEGHNALAAGFPGPASVDGCASQRRLSGSDSFVELRLERHSPTVHARHRKRRAQRRGNAVWPSFDARSGHTLRRFAHLLESRSRGTRDRSQTRRPRTTRPVAFDQFLAPPHSIGRQKLSSTANPASSRGIKSRPKKRRNVSMRRNGALPIWATFPRAVGQPISPRAAVCQSRCIV
jgi:hypothetical protein